MKLAEFFVDLLVNTDNKALQDFSKSTQDVALGLGKITAVASAAIWAVDKFVDGTIRGVVSLSNFNKQTGMFIENLQEWQVAGQLSDISLSAEQVTSSIMSMQDNLTQIRLGGGNVAPYQLLGVNVAGKNAIQVLEDLRGAIKGLDNSTAVNLIKQTGLSPNFINVLRLSREEFNKLTKENFLNPKQRETILELGTAITHLKIRMSLFKDQVVVKLAPLLFKLIDAFYNVSDAIKVMFDSVSNSSTALKVIIPIIALLISVLAPFAVKVIAVALVIEDLFTLIMGGESVIGKLAKAFVDIGNIMQNNFVETIEQAVEWWGVLVSWIDKALIKINEFADILKGGFFDRLDKLKELAQDPMGTARDIGKSIMGSVSNSFSNIFNINSDADAEAIANNVIEKQQHQLNYSYDDFNRGFVR